MFKKSLGHPPYADEPVDVMEQMDFHPVSRVALAKITACLGIACYLPAAACDTCKFEKEQVDLTDVQKLLKKFGNRFHLPSQVSPMFQTRNDALLDLFSFASTGRGSRSRAELRVAGRMGF